MSVEAAVERLDRIEKLLQELVAHQKRTAELLQKVLPEAVSRMHACIMVDEKELKRVARDKSKSPKHRIVAALELNPEGLSILAIAKTTGLARNTVRTHINDLKDMDLIKIERIGGATGKKCILKMKYHEALERLREVKIGPA